MHDILRKKIEVNEVNVSTYLYYFIGPGKAQKRKKSRKQQKYKKEGNLKKISMTMTLKALLSLVTMIWHHCLICLQCRQAHTVLAI